jgi:hypothetical protein
LNVPKNCLPDTHRIEKRGRIQRILQALAQNKPRIHLVAIPHQSEIICSTPGEQHVHFPFLSDHEVIVDEVPLHNLSLKNGKNEASPEIFIFYFEP